MTKKKTTTEKERGYNINALMSSKVRIDNAIGMFETDSKGSQLRVKKSGNGAVIQFLKRYIGKKIVVFVIDN